MTRCPIEWTERRQTFYGTNKLPRIDFVATYSHVFVNFTAGRRLQVVPSTGLRDHMPLTQTPHVDDGDHEKIEDMLADPISRLTFFQELGTKIRTSTIVLRAATDATSHVAWETLVRIIQQTAGPYFYQEAPRPTRPLALRLTGASADQTFVEQAKAEVTLIEKQMRRFSWQLLR